MDINKHKSDDEKVELAEKIASQTRRVTKKYEDLESALFRIGRYFSSAIDRFLFNPKYGVLVSLLIAIMIYSVVNLSGENSIFKNTYSQVKIVEDMPIIVDYNSDKWEISGIPQTCDVSLIGDSSTLAMQQSASNSTIVADLNSLSVGTHTVKLEPKNFFGELSVKAEPSVVTVTIKEKVTKNYSISYDYINTDKLDSVFALEEPVFDMTKVAVRASQDTLDSVAFIKALIDVEGQVKDFEQDAKLVAYDQNGRVVDADIKPETVKVNVKVTSPNKTVPIIVEPQGEIPNNMAIESILLDHNSLMVYAPQSVLSKIDRITVAFDASQLTKDQRLYRGINLPSGVNSLSVTNLNMEIKLGEMVSKTFDNIPLTYRNNVNKYTLSNSNIQTSYSVEVFGTQTNIDKIKPEDISLYIDMSKVVLGEQSIEILVDQKPELLIKFKPVQASIRINVIGETEVKEENGEEIDG